jgi:hypothetical protein
LVLTHLTTLGATVYAHEDVTSWLREASFTDIDRKSVGPLSGQAVSKRRRNERSPELCSP